MNIVPLSEIDRSDASFVLKNFLPIPRYAVTLLSASGGTGKALYIKEKVLTPNGWATMDNLKVGDSVIGSNGKAIKVIGVYPQGVRPTYNITFVDGTSVICDEDHLWTVKSSSRSSGTFTVKELLSMGYFRDKIDKRYGTAQREFYYGVPTTPGGYEFGNDDNIVLDGYLLGLLLGDGGLTKSSITFTNASMDILNKVKMLLPVGDGLVVNRVKNTFECRIINKDRNHQRSKTSIELERLGLIGHKSIDKFIPGIYKNATLETRRGVIQGLIDTDGYVVNGHIQEYSTSSEMLANDFLEVGRSIGKILTMKSRMPKFTYKQQSKVGEKNFRIYEKIQTNKKITNIEKIEDKEMVCIKVDSQDELFVVNGYNLTHNTRLSLIMADKFIKENDEFVALWLTEDYPGQIRASFEDMAKSNIVSLSSMAKMLILLSEPPQLAKRENGIFKANYKAIEDIGKGLILKGVSLAVFDPLLAFYGGNENDNSEARVFIQAFASWANNAKITTVIIHHANKDGASRGATAFHDGVRCRYELSMPLDAKGEIDKYQTKQGLRTATLKKDNWGVRKYLWRLTDGHDDIKLKIMPELDIIKPLETIEFVSEELF